MDIEVAPTSTEHMDSMTFRDEFYIKLVVDFGNLRMRVCLALRSVCDHDFAGVSHFRGPELESGGEWILRRLLHQQSTWIQ